MTLLPDARRRRGSWGIATPLIAFVVIAAGWTAAWTYLAGEAGARFDDWIRAEAARGHQHRCADRAVGGWPFRIDITCRDAAYVFDTPQGRMEARFGALVATAMVYRPDHVIVDLRSPFHLAQAGGGEVASVEFQRGRASVRIAQNRLARFSLELARPVLARAPAARPDAVATALELHVGHATQGGDPRDFDVALALSGLGPAGVRPEQGIALAIDGLARRWPTGGEGGAAGLVARWAQDDGSFQLRALRASRGNGLLTASGSLGFTRTGRAQGEARALVADLSALLGGLDIPGVGDPSAYLGPALALVGRPAEVEQRRGTELTVRIQEGALSLGAIQLLTFPPVF